MQNSRVNVAPCLQDQPAGLGNKAGGSVVPETPRRQQLKYEWLLVLMSAIWGSTFVAQQIGMRQGLGPMTFNGLRFALGCLVLLPVIAWRQRRGWVESPTAPLPVAGSFLAGLFLFAAASFQQIGLQYTTSAQAGFITGLYLVIVPLLGLMLGQSASRSLWVAIVVSLAGLYLLSVTDGLRLAKGDGLILVCAFLWAGQILVIDRIAKQGDPLRIAGLQFAVCAILSTLAALLFEECTANALRAGLGAVVYAGALSVGVAFTLQVVCQKRCPPGPAAVIMSLEAVFAALTGYLVLQQTLTPRAWVGCGLMLAGVLIVQLPVIRARSGSKQPG